MADPGADGSGSPALQCRRRGRREPSAGTPGSPVRRRQDAAGPGPGSPRRDAAPPAPTSKKPALPPILRGCRRAASRRRGTFPGSPRCGQSGGARLPRGGGGGRRGPAAAPGRGRRRPDPRRCPAVRVGRLPKQFRVKPAAAARAARSGARERRDLAQAKFCSSRCSKTGREAQ